MRVLLFQAIRELLTNVAKHANARNVSVSIKKRDGNLEIIVKDDGSGFDTTKLKPGRSVTNGFGLFSIREPIELMCGKLKIESKPGCGTKVTAIVPL